MRSVFDNNLCATVFDPLCLSVCLSNKMIISLVLIFLTLALLYLYFTWHNNHWAKLRVPHIKPQIFVGNTPNGLLQKRNAYYDIQDVFE